MTWTHDLTLYQHSLVFDMTQGTRKLQLACKGRNLRERRSWERRRGRATRGHGINEITQTLHANIHGSILGIKSRELSLCVQFPTGNPLRYSIASITGSCLISGRSTQCRGNNDISCLQMLGCISLLCPYLPFMVWSPSPQLSRLMLCSLLE